MLSLPGQQKRTFRLAVADLILSTRRFVKAAESNDHTHLHGLERAFAKRLFTGLDVALDVRGLDHINPKQPCLVVATQRVTTRCDCPSSP